MFKIITADERLAQPKKIKGAIFGPHGIGKTSLLRTLNPETTLFLDLEGGDLAVQDVKVDQIKIKTWIDAINMACLITGPDPSRRSDQSYSQQHYDHVVSQGADPGFLKKYDTIFIDSISVASRLCWQHCSGQPESFSEKSGKPDQRGTYGLLGREMLKWLSVLQHADKHIFVVGGLDRKEDEFGRTRWEPQIDGSKTALELPGLFDLVISMVDMKAEDGTSYRAFITGQLNEWRYPAKDRSGLLDMVEPPHLGKLMSKILGGRK
jgi:hypothetical protein